MVAVPLRFLAWARSGDKGHLGVTCAIEGHARPTQGVESRALFGKEKVAEGHWELVAKGPIVKLNPMISLLPLYSLLRLWTPKQRENVEMSLSAGAGQVVGGILWANALRCFQQTKTLRLKS